MSATMNLKVLSLAVLVGLSLAGCNDDNSNNNVNPPVVQEQKTGSVELKVFDNDSGDLLKDAQITV